VSRVEVEGVARDWLAATGAHAALAVLAGSAAEGRLVVEMAEAILARDRAARDSDATRGAS
jgi:hypothetical protein